MAYKIIPKLMNSVIVSFMQPLVDNGNEPQKSGDKKAPADAQSKAFNVDKKVR